MPELLSGAQFVELLNSKFRLQMGDSHALELELVEAKDISPTPDNEVYSIIFLGPLQQFLQQGSYRLEHDQLGKLEIFLVPVGKIQEGFRYEAVFNLLKDIEQPQAGS